MRCRANDVSGAGNIGATQIINLAYGRWDDTNLDHIWDTLTPANDKTLGYSDAARLSSATGTYGTRAWTYDANGNRLTETVNGVVNTYTYPATSNRLTNVKQGTVTTRAFTYDAAGNATQDLRGATAYNYAVNAAGRIRTLTIGATLRATWTYDGFQKLRIKAATTPAATTHYVWDTFGHIIAEHNATGGAALKQYIWLGDTPLAVFDNTTLYYVHPDHLDRPVAMTNAAAMTLAWAAKYDPFGNPVAVTVSPVNNQRLPGQWYQLEDGLAYNWHRSYDPTLGRYSQADPLGFVDGPNIFNYVGNSPAMGVDPKGLAFNVKQCGRCRIYPDRDGFKGKHYHWECPGKDKGCVKPDGTSCDGSPPPPPDIEKCLKDQGWLMCIPENLPPYTPFPAPKAPTPAEAGALGAIGLAILGILGLVF